LRTSGITDDGLREFVILTSQVRSFFEKALIELAFSHLKEFIYPLATYFGHEVFDIFFNGVPFPNRKNSAGVVIPLIF
jgi:hypothetical protein